MELVLSLAFRAGLLLYCLVVPGWALLRAAGFSSASKLDWILACFAGGAATTSLTVTTLLLAGLYFRPVAIVFLLAPLGYLAWSHARSHPPPAERARQLLSPETTTAAPLAARGGTPASHRGRRGAPLARRDDREYREYLREEQRSQRGCIAGRMQPELHPGLPDAIDRAVTVAAVAFLAVYLADAWTSPITWWDGLASWGKWAADWGRRTSSANYVVGGYPQLVPRIVSVMYKLTGAHSDVLPLDFIALHGFYVLFAGWFLLAALHLARLLGMPAWPVILAGLGSIQFREHSGAGTVDVLVSALLCTLLALYFGLRRGTWRARRESLVLGAAAFAVIFTKWTGGIALVLLFLLDRASQAAYPLAPDRAATLRRSVYRALAIAAIGMLPFVVEQGASELRIGRWRPDPFEMNISLRQIPTLLSTDATVVYRGGGAGVRAELVQLRFWNSYDVPATLRLVFTAFLFLCLIASTASWFGRATLPVIVAYGVVWLFWSSYDQRNIFGLLPVVGLSASFGASRLWTLWPRAIWPNAVAVMAGLFLVLAGGGLLREAQARATSLARGDRPIRARLAAMRGSVPDRVSLFYPQFEQDYRFISALSARTDAAHVLITFPLFRFFERGAHALSLWPYELVRPGDVFAAHEYHAPPADPRWVLLARHPPNRVWLRVAGMRPVTLRLAETPAADSARRFLYDVERDDFGEAGFVVWRATVKGGAQGVAVFTTTGDLALDPALVSTACEAADISAADHRCSGIVALSPDALASYRSGQLAVGVESDGDPAGVTLTVAQPLRPPDGPRRSPASGPGTKVSVRR